VLKTAEFAPAFERCLTSNVASIIHVKTSLEQINSRTTITKMREAHAAKKH
jgi:acetolactate synthase I/II/III large subunit